MVVSLVLLEPRGAVVLDGALDLWSRVRCQWIGPLGGSDLCVSRNAVRSAAKFDFYTVADAALVRTAVPSWAGCSTARNAFINDTGTATCTTSSFATAFATGRSKSS